MDLNKIYYLAKPFSVITTENGYIFYTPVSNKIVELNRDGVALLLLFKDGSSILDALGKLNIGQRGIEDLLQFLKDQQNNALLFSDKILSSKVSFEAKSQVFKPQKVYIHLTSLCNQDCIYCYNKEHRTHQSDDLTTKEIKRLIREVKELGGTEISFTGGEPLLRKDLEEILRFTSECGLKSYIITNGSVNDDKTVETVARYVNFINVSLDSAHENEHDEVRGSGTWRKSVTFLKKLVEAGRTDAFSRAVVTKHNIDNILEYPVFVKSLGCALAPISVYLPNSVEEIEKYDLLPDMDRYWEVIQTYDDLLTREFEKTNFLDEYFENNTNCGMGNGIVSIDSNGDVYPCQSLHFDEFKAGNIRKNSLFDVGNNSPQLRSIRGWRITDVSDCATCSYAKICGGGCRAIAYNLTKNVDGFNELFCSYYKRLTEFWLKRVVESGRRGRENSAQL